MGYAFYGPDQAAIHHVLRLYPPRRVLESLAGAGLEAEARDYTTEHPPIPGWTVFLARKPR